jgi:hypothetical protein
MKGNSIRAIFAVGLLILLLGTAKASAGNDDPKGSPVIPQLTVSPTFSDSTVPPNGDVNPYGVAFVPSGFSGGGPLHTGVHYRLEL